MQILLNGQNTLSVSSCYKLFALQRMQAVHSYVICWRQGCMTQCVQYSTAGIKIRPIKYTVCGKVIVSPWWWCWGLSIWYWRVIWLARLLFASLPSIYVPANESRVRHMLSPSIHSHFKQHSWGFCQMYCDVFGTRGESIAWVSSLQRGYVWNIWGEAERRIHTDLGSISHSEVSNSWCDFSNRYRLKGHRETLASCKIKYRLLGFFWGGGYFDLCVFLSGRPQHWL